MRLILLSILTGVIVLSAGFSFAQERSAGDDNGYSSSSSDYSYHEYDTDQNHESESYEHRENRRSRRERRESTYDAGGSTSGGSDARPARDPQPERERRRPGRR